MFGIQFLRDNFSHDQRYLIVAVFALILPFYLCGAVHIFLVIRLLITGEIQESFRRTTHGKYIVAFCLLSAAVSLFYGNMMGLATALGILNEFCLIFFYRKHVTPALFEFLVDVIIWLSVISAVYALIEYVGILNKFDIDQIEIIVFNTPKYRINSFYFNANYYAMMIEFFVAITFYKLLRTINKKYILYNIRRISELSLIIFLNLFVLYLTGCRTAWPALLIAIIMMLFANHNRKISAIITSAAALGAGFFALNPDMIPRTANLVSYLGVRMKIWKVALMNIKTHFLFGEGPFTYNHIYKLYNGHPTQHSHNIYIDALLCFGIVGIALVIPYVIDALKDIFHLQRNRINNNLLGLIIAFVVIVMIHGIFDCTIMFVQTGFLFLLIIHSFTAYRAFYR
ncbi:MAG: O-antigen ligase family protein [Erysipelotrichaceae bacterium]|nr:O-antigen ligase family protein [Erysipelotrichaceae bacterium]